MEFLKLGREENFSPPSAQGTDEQDLSEEAAAGAAGTSASIYSDESPDLLQQYWWLASLPLCLLALLQVRPHARLGTVESRYDGAEVRLIVPSLYHLVDRSETSLCSDLPLRIEFLVHLHKLVLAFQFLPFPSWLLGFLTGCVVAFAGSCFAAFRLQLFGGGGGGGGGGDGGEGHFKFVDHVRKRVPKRRAIIVQEELERNYVWMNTWPAKNGVYDPLTYDVRRTVSVRVMLHGPWVELRFPRRNLPLRRMYGDPEPAGVAFLEHKEVLDLTNCSVELFPENLPQKRVWSKKYPIRIRTNVRKLGGGGAAANGSNGTSSGKGSGTGKVVVKPSSSGDSKGRDAADPAEATGSKESSPKKVCRGDDDDDPGGKISPVVRMRDLEESLDGDSRVGIGGGTEGDQQVDMKRGEKEDLRKFSEKMRIFAVFFLLLLLLLSGIPRHSIFTRRISFVAQIWKEKKPSPLPPPSRNLKN